MKTSDSPSNADLLADYHELLRIVKQRPAGILTQSETRKLIACLEKCIAEIEIEIAQDVEKADGQSELIRMDRAR
jgi:hypothetical protein